MTYNPVSDKEWHNQRYGKTSVKAQQAYDKKLNEWETINEYNKAKKVSNLAAAETIFQEHGISYEVRRHAWYCQVGHEFFYYYPKSGKWRVEGKDTIYTSRSAADFLGKVVRHQIEKAREILKRGV